MIPATKYFHFQTWLRGVEDNGPETSATIDIAEVDVDGITYVAILKKSFKKNFKINICYTVVATVVVWFHHLRKLSQNPCILMNYSLKFLFIRTSERSHLKLRRIIYISNIAQVDIDRYHWSDCLKQRIITWGFQNHLIRVCWSSDNKLMVERIFVARSVQWRLPCCAP